MYFDKNIFSARKLFYILSCACICTTEKDRRPIISGYNDDIPIIEGRELTLDCSHGYKSQVRYRWILSSEPRNGFYEHDSKISFISVDRNDHIFVTCEIFSLNVSLGVSRHVLVEAHYMDRPQVFAKDWDVRISDPFTITCSVESHPKAEMIEILKDGKRLYRAIRLKTYHAQKSDAGNYRCRARNAFFTRVSHEYQLTVGGISKKENHTVALLVGPLFPLIMIILLCITLCRRYSRKRAKKKLAIPETSDPISSTNVLQEDNNIYSVGRYHRENDVVPPSYSEAISDENNLPPPSYAEITIHVVRPVTLLSIAEEAEDLNEAV